MKTLEEAAASLYDENLPYHNFEHARSAVAIGKRMCERCTEEGIAIDEEVVEKALLFHDAGYQEDVKVKGFSSKEEYAAFLAKNTLEKFGFTEQFITQVCRAIISTHRDKSFETAEEKVVRASDLAGLAGEYAEFLNNNIKLRQEAIMLSGKDITWTDWKEATKKVVEFYVSQDIHLTKAYEDEKGESIFHTRAQKNLQAFLNAQSFQSDGIN